LLLKGNNGSLSLLGFRTRPIRCATAAQGPSGIIERTRLLGRQTVIPYDLV